MTPRVSTFMFRISVIGTVKFHLNEKLITIDIKSVAKFKVFDGFFFNSGNKVWMKNIVGRIENVIKKYLVLLKYFH